MKYRLMRIKLWLQLIGYSIIGDSTGACVASTWLTLTRIDKKDKSSDGWKS